MAFFKGSKLKFEAVRLVAFGSVGASYAALGTATAKEAAFLMITSSLDKDAYLSFDGSTDHIYIAAGQILPFDIQGNHAGTGTLTLPKGTTIYQKRGPGGASGSGNLVVMVGYAG